MARYSEDELLRLACLYAEQDRAGFLDAYSHMPNDTAAKEAEAFLQQLKEYRLKRWGRTKVEAAIEEGTPVKVRQAVTIRNDIEE